MEPFTPERALKLSPKGEKAEALANMLLELQNLPYGAVNMEKKDELARKLIAAANDPVFDELEKARALRIIKEADERSRMTKEQAESARDKKYLGV